MKLKADHDLTMQLQGRFMLVVLEVCVCGLVCV